MPKTIFLRRSSNALGDNILLSLLLPDLRKKYPNYKIIVESKFPEIFFNNPNIDWVTDKHIKTTRKHIKPKYVVKQYTTLSIFEQMMNYIGEKKKASPIIYLTKEEKEKKKDFNPYIVIAPVGKRGYCANRKDWGFDNFQELVNILKKKYQIFQIGMPKDPMLSGVYNARFIDIRKTASIISKAELFIGLEGGLMHLARSVDTKSIIIFGGYIKPSISGYDINTNIYSDIECSPCYTSEVSHEFCSSMKCMESITPKYVYEKVIEKLI